MSRENAVKRLKCFIFLFLVIVFSGFIISASAGRWYVRTPDGKTVNIRDYDTGKVIGQIPYGTAVYANEDSTETAAYVTYNGIGGLVKWKYLVKEKPAPYQGKIRTASSKPKPTEEPGTFGEGSRMVSVSGGVLQFPNKKGKAAGTKYTAVRYDETTELIVTAVIPKGKKIDCWIINNVRVRLSVKSFALTAENQDISLEVIFR